MEFLTRPEFDDELGKLLKRFRSLSNDLGSLKEILIKYPRGYEPVVFRINNLGIETEVYKVKHFRCQTLKNKGSRSGIRIIYAYFDLEKKIEFVEIYYKEKDDTDCDKERIFKYYK